jgi:hypothetical protein
MKTMLILAVAATALASAASAQIPSPPRQPPAARDLPPPPPGQGPAARRFDGPGGPGGVRGRATPEARTQRRADLFARMDGNRDGQVTFEEYRAFIEAERLARQKRQFERFSGGQSAVTLDQLNARALQRERDLEQRFEQRRQRRDSPGPPRGPNL